jgi:hypothetical protein
MGELKKKIENLKIFYDFSNNYMYDDDYND